MWSINNRGTAVSARISLHQWRPLIHHRSTASRLASSLAIARDSSPRTSLGNGFLRGDFQLPFSVVVFLLRTELEFEPATTSLRIHAHKHYTTSPLVLIQHVSMKYPQSWSKMEWSKKFCQIDHRTLTPTAAEGNSEPSSTFMVRQKPANFLCVRCIYIVNLIDPVCKLKSTVKSNRILDTHEEDSLKIFGLMSDARSFKILRTSFRSCSGVYLQSMLPVCLWTDMEPCLINSSRTRSMPLLKLQRKQDGKIQPRFQVKPGSNARGGLGKRERVIRHPMEQGYG